jgi:hypothetical protein
MSFNLMLMIALTLGGLFLLARIARKGLGSSLEERKKAFAERLRKTDAETKERTLSASSFEQMLPIAAAAREMLELTGNPPGFALLEEGKIVRLQCPDGEMRIVFALSSRPPANPKGKKTGAQGRWHIFGPNGEHEEYGELAEITLRIKERITQGARAR